MREIKFRAWDHRLQYMFYDIHRAYEGLPYPQREHDADKYDRLNEEHCPQSFDSFLELNQFEIMQFPGLKDKNGKEIYEGDIFKESKSIGIIIYEDSSFKIDWKIDRDFWSNSLKHHAINGEIVGNIYENPELLEVSNV